MNQIGKLTLPESYSIRFRQRDLESKKYVSPDSIQKPFFIIMHESEGRFWLRNKQLSVFYPNILKEWEREIDELKSKYDYLSHELYPATLIYQDTPLDRPILVTGCFDHDCVTKQRDSLVANGFEARISTLGLFPIINLEYLEI